MSDNCLGSEGSMPEQSIYEGMVLAAVQYADSIVESIRDLDTDPRDVIIASYARSGTTWLQHILWLLYNDADIEKSMQTPLAKRMPSIEWRDDRDPSGSGVELFKSQEPPRLFKTHLSARYFEKQIQAGDLKIIFVIRNIKDALVSFFHFYQGMKHLEDFTGSWEAFFEQFKAGKLLYGSWYENVCGWIKLRHLKNVLVVRYEDLKLHLATEVKRINNFCETEMSPQQIRFIAEHSTFAAMKNNPGCNHQHAKSHWKNEDVKFFRKGQVGVWKSYFTVTQSEYIDTLVDKLHEETGIDKGYLLGEPY